VKSILWKALSPLISSLIVLNVSSLAYGQGMPSTDAKMKMGRFSFGFVTGYYQPELSTLNSVINDRNQAILEDPNFLLPSNPDFRAEDRNIPAGKIGGEPWVGLETQWELSDSFALRLSGGVWRGEQIASDNIVTFLRSNLPQITAPRSARYNLTIDQVFLDWRYYFLNDPKRGRISLDLGVLGMSVGFLTIDSLVKVVHPAAPNGGFASLSSTEAMGMAYTSRYGLTGEYFLGKKLSLAFSGHYVLGRMTKLKVKRHFPAGFPQVPIPEPLSINPTVPLPSTPVNPVEGERVSYATTVSEGRVESIGPQKDLILELDGLEVSGHLRFHF